MKRSVRYLLMMVVAVITLSVWSMAQEATYQVHVNIPFEFYAAGQQFPAGAYLFTVGYGAHEVTLRSKQTGRSFSLMAIPDDGDASGQAYVEFEIAGGRHRLADIRTQNSGVDFFPEQSSTTTTAHDHKTVAIVAMLR